MLKDRIKYSILEVCLFFFKFICLFLFLLKSKKRVLVQRKIFHVLSHFPQTLATSGAGPVGSQKPETSSWFHRWVAGTMCLSYYLLPLRVHISSKLDGKQSNRNLNQRSGMGCWHLKWKLDSLRHSTGPIL